MGFQSSSQIFLLPRQKLQPQMLPLWVKAQIGSADCVHCPTKQNFSQPLQYLIKFPQQKLQIKMQAWCNFALYDLEHWNETSQIAYIQETWINF